MCTANIVWKTNQSLENTGSFSGDTGHDIPQSVLELVKLQSIGDFLGAQVCKQASLETD